MDTLLNPLFLLFATAFVGLALGKVRLGRFKLGVSGALFAGMFVGWLVYSQFAAPYESALAVGGAVPATAARILTSGVLDKQYFQLFLTLFVAAVGLAAAKDARVVLRRYGARFALLASVITLSGASVAYILFRAVPGLNHLAIGGVYTGALTSSPGLGVALETVGRLFSDPTLAKNAEGAVGAGYAVAYPFAVVTVITAVQLLPRLFRIDTAVELRQLELALGGREDAASSSADAPAGFDMAAFAITCVAGYLLGMVRLPLGTLGTVSLESTGGVLVASLVLGSLRRLGPIRFRMGGAGLNAIKELALVFFLGYVGLNYGYQAVGALAGPSLLMAAVGIACTLTALMVGFVVGRYVLNINWVLLSGAICGGMTSTPGLGAAVDVTGSDQAAAGYGATYPIGLLFKVLIVLILYRLPK
jgi:putative transport protein